MKLCRSKTFATNFATVILEKIPGSIMDAAALGSKNSLLRISAARNDSYEPYSCSNFTKASKMETSGFPTLNARSKTTLVSVSYTHLTLPTKA